MSFAVYKKIELRDLTDGFDFSLSGCKGLWSSGTGVGGYQNNKKQEGFLKPSPDWSATARAYEQTWHWDEVLYRYLNSYS